MTLALSRAPFARKRKRTNSRQVEQNPGGRGRGEWATLGVHPLSWLLSNNRLENVPFLSVPHTSSNRLLLSNQDKGCTPSVAHSLPLPLGPALLNRVWNRAQRIPYSCTCHIAQWSHVWPDRNSFYRDEYRNNKKMLFSSCFCQKIHIKHTELSK